MGHQSIWVRAGLSVHRASRQAILCLNGCPAQRQVSSHSHCQLWLPHRPAGQAPAARVSKEGGGERPQRREQPVPVRQARWGRWASGPGPLCSGAQWQPGIIHQTEGPIEILTRRGPGGRDFPGLASWLRAVHRRVTRPHKDHAEVWSLPQERGPCVAFPGTHREAANSSNRAAELPLPRHLRDH